MALKYECDGCGHTTGDARIVQPVSVEIRSKDRQGPENYYLCGGCERTLIRQANPTTWPRAKES